MPVRPLLERTPALGSASEHIRRQRAPRSLFDERPPRFERLHRGIDVVTLEVAVYALPVVVNQ